MVAGSPVSSDALSVGSSASSATSVIQASTRERRSSPTSPAPERRFSSSLPRIVFWKTESTRRSTTSTITRVLAIDHVRIRSRSLELTGRQPPRRKLRVVSTPSRITTRVESAPATSCHAIAVYSPGGTPAIWKRPSESG